MDEKLNKRIDSLYRNLRSFPLLIVVSVLIPIFLLFLPLLSLAYLYLRGKLLREIDSGMAIIEPAPDLPYSKVLTPAQKVDRIREYGKALWVPIIFWILIVGLIIILAAAIYFLKP
jgi:hypothetical protein